jgi:two-component system, cell cycle sensor histidine kinase and response regulator CckA
VNSCAGVESVIHGIELETALETVPQTVLADAAKPLTAAVFAESDQRGGPETILLVEDEAFVRKVTAEVLESAGYKLLVARSAAEALEAYRSYPGPLHLLLADVVMPGMSGRELATELETLYPRARVLLMSGFAEQLALCELSPYGQPYMAKPFSIRMLLKTVRELLDKPVDSGRA